MSNQTTTPLSVGDKKTAVLERCPVCGKATKMRVWGYEVAAVCACVEEKRRQEELRRQEYERNLTICRNKEYSLMDDKTRDITFDRIKADSGNSRHIAAAQRYCERWDDNYRNNRGLLFYGATGRGKTTLACCIANELLSRGVSVRMVSVNKLIQRIKDSFNDNGGDSEAAVKRDIKAADLLILDDLGAEYKSDWSTTLVYELVDERYRSRKPTIITTNLPLDKLREHLTDSNGIPRAYDRIVEIMSPVEFNGANYRMAAARKNNSEYGFFSD